MKENTRLGLSVNILGAAVYFAAFFGGYIPAFFLAGYILLFESDAWLKKASVKSIVLLMSFGILTAVIGFVPELLSMFGMLASLFGGSVQYSGAGSMISVILKAAEIMRTVLFLLLGIRAFKHQTVFIPFIDGVVDRHMHVGK